MKLLNNLLILLSILCNSYSYSYSLNKISCNKIIQYNKNNININQQESSSISKFKLPASENSLHLEKYGIIQPIKRVDKVLDTLTNAFPIWVFSFSVLGFKYPSLFTWFAPYVKLALGLTMTAMGMTLSLSDFKKVEPKYIAIGFLAQYTIMPLAALSMAKLFSLSPEFSAGLILVGSAPGGTASNLVTLIAQADLALSVLMTTVSTLLAVIMTPFLTQKLAGSFVEVKASELVNSCLEVVLGPILLGVGLNFKFPNFCNKVSKLTPFLSVLLVALICGSVSASNAGIPLGKVGMNLLGAVGSLHLLGFGLGYLVSISQRTGEKRARTISIETGMQNSALAVVLAKHFPSPLLCSLPGAISATCHSVIGSTLATIWRNRTPLD